MGDATSEPKSQLDLELESDDDDDDDEDEEETEIQEVCLWNIWELKEAECDIELLLGLGIILG